MFCIQPQPRREVASSRLATFFTGIFVTRSNIHLYCMSSKRGQRLVVAIETCWLNQKCPFFSSLDNLKHLSDGANQKFDKSGSSKCTKSLICWFRGDGWGVDYDLEILNIFLPTIGLETPSGGGEYTHVSSGIPHSVDCKGSQRYSHISLFSW